MSELIGNGKLKIIRITSDLYDDVIEFHKKNYQPYENLSLACGLINSAEGIAESAERLRIVLENGVSFGVRQEDTGDLAAVCINKFLPFTLPPYRAACLISLENALKCLKDSFDVIKDWNIDCALEISFISTHHDFRGLGLATILAQHAVNFARQMLDGTLPEAEKDQLPLHIRDLKPKAVTSLFTTPFTQKIGDKLGMKTMFKVPFAELDFEGKSFVDKIHGTYLTVGAMRL